MLSLFQSVSQHFGSFYPALPNPCEALVAMHTIFTHSKDLPEDIFKAVAQLVFRLLSCRHFFSQSALRFFYPALPNTCEAFVAMHTKLHIARTCLRTSLKQVHSLSSDSSLVVTSSVSTSVVLSCATKHLQRPSCCNAHYAYT